MYHSPLATNIVREPRYPANEEKSAHLLDPRVHKRAGAAANALAVTLSSPWPEHCTPVPARGKLPHASSQIVPLVYPMTHIQKGMPITPKTY